MQAQSIKVENITPWGDTWKGYKTHYAKDVETGKSVKFSLKEANSLETDDNTITELFYKEKVETQNSKGEKQDKLSSVRFQPFQWEDKGFTKSKSSSTSSSTNEHRDTYAERLDWEMGEKQRNLSFQGILKCYTELLALCGGDEELFEEKRKFLVNSAYEDSAKVLELLAEKNEEDES